MRSRIDTRACTTQSSPISTCRPITTCGARRSRTDARAVADHGERPDRHASPSVTPAPMAAVGCTPGAAARDRQRARPRGQTPDRDAGAQHRARGRFGRLGEDDGRRARRAQRGRVLGVGEEGQIARRPHHRSRRRRGCRCPDRLRGGTRGAPQCPEVSRRREYLTGLRAQGSGVQGSGSGLRAQARASSIVLQGILPVEP